MLEVGTSIFVSILQAAVQTDIKALRSAPHKVPRIYAPFFPLLPGCTDMRLKARADRRGWSPNGFIELSLNDRTIPFLMFFLDKTVFALALSPKDPR